MALKLWSKLENAGDVTSPQIGTGGSVIGSPTYPAAKFNNGLLSDVDSEGCKFPTGANNINLDKGTIELWAKMKFAPNHGAYHYFWSFDDASNGGVYLYFSYTEDDFVARVRSGGASTIIATSAGLSWNVDDLLHVAVTWDREGNDIGASKTLALYVNNVEVASSTTTWAADTVLADLIVGLHGNETTLHSDMVIDNIKIHDVCKTDFSDRGHEGTEEVFGKTVKGGTLLGNSSDKIYWCKFQSGSAGTLASISVYFYKSSGSSNVKCAIYDSSKNQIANGETEEKLVGVNDGFVSFDFPTPPSVDASTDYYLCVWNDTIGAVYGDAGGVNQLGRDDLAYDGWPASLATYLQGNWDL